MMIVVEWVIRYMLERRYSQDIRMGYTVYYYPKRRGRCSQAGQTFFSMRSLNSDGVPLHSKVIGDVRASELYAQGTTRRLTRRFYKRERSVPHVEISSD